MQTFLPYSDYKKSAEVLDYKRLGKQRVEGLQILYALNETGYDKNLDLWVFKKSHWINHPASIMWKNNQLSLCNYIECIILEWIQRGYKNTCLQKLQYIKSIIKNKDNSSPSWLGNEEFHASHRSNLLRKNFEYYKKFNWVEPDDLPYIWPK